MASMADGEVRHDLLLLDTLRRRTNKIRRGNRRGRCPPAEIDMGDLPAGALGGRRGDALDGRRGRRPAMRRR